MCCHLLPPELGHSLSPVIILELSFTIPLISRFLCLLVFYLGIPEQLLKNQVRTKDMRDAEDFRSNLVQFFYFTNQETEG